MTKPYDSTSKFLLEGFPGDWLALAGLEPQGPVDLIDANLSTITAEADKVIRVGRPRPLAGSLRAASQSRPAARGAAVPVQRPARPDRHDLPTRSVVILLRPEADGPGLTGEYRRTLPGGPDYLTFRYGILRVWEAPVEAFLDGGLGTLPLAPIADLGAMPVEAVIEAIERRIDQTPPALGGLLWTSTSILMGMRYPADLIASLVRGARQMKESTFYQAILAEGEALGEARGEARGQARGEVIQAKRLLVRLGERRFGSILPADRETLDAITRSGRLEDLCELVVIAPVATWGEFLMLAGSLPSI